MLKNASVLIVDDEEIMREILHELLVHEGCNVHLAASGMEALKLAKTELFDVALVDITMPKIDGLTTLDELKKINNDLPVIMVTAFGTTANTRDAFKRGAFDFIEKPFKNQDLIVVLRNAIAQHRLVIENKNLRKNLKGKTFHFENLIGHSPRMNQVFNLVTQTAPSRSTILVQGESGTGKELVARAIHLNSLRSSKPFITVNSGSLPPDLLESNLFGHAKGAFTGAVAMKKGLFELANTGSIFFDEIGSIPLETQAKLLRVIQEREFMRLGETDTLKVDVRIITATNVDLKQMVQEGMFREDLYYRLQVITIMLPPLRERKEDIPLLVQHFLEKHGEENSKTNLELDPSALKLLEEYQWPGNVRELENVIERAVVLTATNKIDVNLIPENVVKAGVFQLPDFEIPLEGVPLRKIIDEIESTLISRSLKASGGVQKQAAALLQIKPTTLNEMLKRHGLRPRKEKILTQEKNQNKSDQASTNTASLIEKS